MPLFFSMQFGWSVKSPHKDGVRDRDARSCFLLILFTLSSLAAIAEESGTSADEHLRKAHEFDQSGRFAESVAEASLALESSPNNEQARTLRANVYFKLGKFKEALQDYDVAVGLWPDHIRLRDWRANARLFDGDFQGALEDANLAVTGEPTNTSFLRTRAKTNMLLERFAEAASDFRLVLSLEQAGGAQIGADHLLTWASLALGGDMIDAKGVLSSALTQHPEADTAWRKVARAILDSPARIQLIDDMKDMKKTEFTSSRAFIYVMLASQDLSEGQEDSARSLAKLGLDCSGSNKFEALLAKQIVSIVERKD